MKYPVITIILLLCSLSAHAQTQKDRDQVVEYLQEQQYDKMIYYLQPLVNNNDVKDLSLLAFAFYQSGKVTDAATIYERILSLDSNVATALQNLAGIRMQQSQYARALTSYKRLLRLRPDNAPAWRQAGNAAYALGQADSGFAWFSRSYQLNPSDGQVVLRLAEHWIDLKKYDIADSLLSIYLKTDSLNTSVLQLAVKAAYLLKRYEHVIKIGEQLRMQQVILPVVFSYVTAACYQLKRYKDCISIYDYLGQNKISSENITYYASLAYTELKEFKKSNILLQACITMAKSDMLETYYHCSSLNYESLKQYKPTLACLDSSYYFSHQILRLYSIGRIYETRLGNTTTAMKYYKRFLQLYKNGSDEETAVYNYLKERLKNP